MHHDQGLRCVHCYARRLGASRRNAHAKAKTALGPGLRQTSHAIVRPLRPPFLSFSLPPSVVYSGESQRHWKLQLMLSSPSFDYQTWRKGSLPGGWKRTGTIAIVVSPRASKWLRSFRNICVSLRSTITGCRQTQVFGVLSDLSPIILPSESKNQHCDEKGVSSRKDFGWHDAFLPTRERENQERSAWLDAAEYADWRSCPAGASRKGNPPRFRPFCE